MKDLFSTLEFPLASKQPSQLWLGVLPSLLILLLLFTPEESQAQQKRHSIEPGTLLIASPELLDPNFQQSVVLICLHGNQGTIGLILNRPTDIHLSKVLPEIKGLEDTHYKLWEGGPVSPNGILMLLETDTPPPNTQEVLEGIYFGGNMNTIESMVDNPDPQKDLRIYIGHAGWFPGQLQMEMARGGWVTFPGNPNLIFEQDPAYLWSHLLQRLTTPHNLTALPESSSKGGLGRTLFGDRFPGNADKNLGYAFLSQTRNRGFSFQSSPKLFNHLLLQGFIGVLP